jgi:peptide/nickel transport system permease protein
MQQYIARRCLEAIPTLLLVSIVLFTLLHIAPGGPMAIYASSPYVDRAELEAIERRLGLQDPLPVQYAKWLKGMLGGDWGLSYKYARGARLIVFERVPATMQLVAVAVLISLLFAIPFGVVAAVNRRPFIQYMMGIVSMLGVSVPTFWLGIMILLLFSVQLGLIPSGGIQTIGQPTNLWDRISHLIAPGFVLATFNIAGWSRYVRSSMLEVISQDYIQTARAKGLSERTVVLRHALRNALMPVITLAGLQVGHLMGGSLVTEVVFSWPGMGRLLAESLKARDYPVLMAAFTLMSIAVVLGNILADVTYAIADPRIRLE